MEARMSKKELGGYLGLCEKNKERKNIEFEAVRGEEWQKNRVTINIGCRDYEKRGNSDKVEEQENGQILKSLNVEKPKLWMQLLSLTSVSDLIFLPESQMMRGGK